MRNPIRWTLLLTPILLMGCATTGGRHATPEEPATVAPESRNSKPEVGVASYYAHRFHGRRTASGDAYDENELTAAHRFLPFGTRIRVTNLANERSIVVTVTDRGPVSRRRLIDLSRRAARELGFLRAGITRVALEVLAR
jgi:rare lipoprotein A